MTTSTTSQLPHHRLRVYRAALELLRAVRAANITDRDMRDPRKAARGFPSVSGSPRGEERLSQHRRSCRSRVTGGQGPRVGHRARGSRRGGRHGGNRDRSGRRRRRRTAARAGSRQRGLCDAERVVSGAVKWRARYGPSTEARAAALVGSDRADVRACKQRRSPGAMLRRSIPDTLRRPRSLVPLPHLPPFGTGTSVRPGRNQVCPSNPSCWHRRRLGNTRDQAHKQTRSPTPHGKCKRHSPSPRALRPCKQSCASRRQLPESTDLPGKHPARAAGRHSTASSIRTVQQRNPTAQTRSAPPIGSSRTHRRNARGSPSNHPHERTPSQLDKICGRTRSAPTRVAARIGERTCPRSFPGRPTRQQRPSSFRHKPRALLRWRVALLRASFVRLGPGHAPGGS